MIQPSKKRLHIETSGCCNNNCLFCCDRGTPYDYRMRSGRLFQQRYKTPFLIAAGFKKHIQRQAGDCGILFTTGEPTLNPELPHFVALAKKCGYSPIGIQTNGRLLSYPEFCQKLIVQGVNELNISLHSYGAKTHDALTRTPGSFQEAMAGLKNAVFLKDEYNIRIIVCFTITKLNITHFFKFTRMILNIGKIDGIVFNTLMFSGNAERFFNQLFVSYSRVAEEFKKTIRKFRAFKHTVLPAISISPMPFCLMNGYEEFISVFEQPFQVKNNKIAVLNRDSKQIKIHECKDCVYVDICSGINNIYLKKMGSAEIQCK